MFGSGSDFGEDDSPAAGETRSRSSNLQTFVSISSRYYNSTTQKSVIEFAKAVMWTFFWIRLVCRSGYSLEQTPKMLAAGFSSCRNCKGLHVQQTTDKYRLISITLMLQRAENNTRTQHLRKEVMIGLLSFWGWDPAELDPPKTHLSKHKKYIMPKQQQWSLSKSASFHHISVFPQFIKFQKDQHVVLWELGRQGVDLTRCFRSS